jgi:hypothetical protein
MNLGITLADYLEKIKNCPDKDLTDELGVYDNFPIFLNARSNDVQHYFRNHSEYNYMSTSKLTQRQIHHFSYIPQQLDVQIASRLPQIMTTGSTSNTTPTEKIHAQQQLANYNLSLLRVFPLGDLKLATPSGNRAIARTINDLGQFAIKENMAACLPNAVGWKYLNDTDYTSRIAYHTPIHHEKK